MTARQVGGLMAGRMDGAAGVAGLSQSAADENGLDLERYPLRDRRLVVFDYDGTLGDTMSSIISVARKVLLDFGLTEDELAPIAQIVGPPFPQAFTQVFGMSEKDAREVTRRYREIYDNLGDEAWPPADGVAEMLDALLAQGKTLACASSKRDGLLRRCLASGELARRFSFVEGKLTDGATSKARTVAHVIGQAGFSPRDAVMVGDRRYDIEAAHAAGCAGVGVLWCHTAPRAELEEAGADAIVETPGELVDLLAVPSVRRQSEIHGAGLPKTRQDG